jgi:hypothetical protein
MDCMKIAKKGFIFPKYLVKKTLDLFFYYKMVSLHDSRVTL